MQNTIYQHLKQSRVRQNKHPSTANGLNIKNFPGTLIILAKLIYFL